MTTRRAIIFFLALGLGTSFLAAQQRDGLLSGGEAAKLYQQIGDLMESTSIAVPELARAGAPLIENVRQSAEALQSGATREHIGILYRLLLNARIYLDISDTVPKPAPFAEEVQKQLTQLRDAIDLIQQHFRATLDAREEQLRSADRDNLSRYDEANRNLGSPDPAERRVVFLGDSITDGWPLNQYFPGRPYVNRGISGQITGQMLGRLKADVLNLDPEVVVVLAGTNDISRGVPAEAIRNNLTMIADLAGVYGVKVIFGSLLPVSDYHKDVNPNYERTGQRPPATILELNTWLYQMCKARHMGYVDYHAAMIDADGFLQASLADDGLHPNAAGYKIMAPLVEQAVDFALRLPPAPERKKKRFGIF